MFTQSSTLSFSTHFFEDLNELNESSILGAGLSRAIGLIVTPFPLALEAIVQAISTIGNLLIGLGATPYNFVAERYFPKYRAPKYFTLSNAALQFILTIEKLIKFISVPFVIFLNPSKGKQAYEYTTTVSISNHSHPAKKYSSAGAINISLTSPLERNTKYSQLVKALNGYCSNEHIEKSRSINPPISFEKSLQEVTLKKPVIEKTIESPSSDKKLEDFFKDSRNLVIINRIHSSFSQFVDSLKESYASNEPIPTKHQLSLTLDFPPPLKQVLYSKDGKDLVDSAEKILLKMTQLRSHLSQPDSKGITETVDTVNIESDSKKREDLLRQLQFEVGNTELWKFFLLQRSIDEKAFLSDLETLAKTSNDPFFKQTSWLRKHRELKDLLEDWEKFVCSINEMEQKRLQLLNRLEKITIPTGLKLRKYQIELSKIKKDLDLLVKQLNSAKKLLSTSAFHKIDPNKIQSAENLASLFEDLEVKAK